VKGKKMKTKPVVSAALIARKVAFLAVLTELLVLFAPSAWAVPSFARRYGIECSTCHAMWGALNGAGVQFRLSGYRAIGGTDLTPISEDIEISKGVSIPSTLPLSFITGVGVDYRTEKREVIGAGGSSITSKGSSLALEDASIFMTSPLGKHLSTFVEFPMYETRAWEFTPTGNFEARYNTRPGRQIQFSTESPTFEVAKFFWNNPLGDSTPRDSFNLLGGITHLPLAYSPGKVHLSVNQYLIYERTALGLLSPRKVDTVVGGDPNDFLFRLSEPQILAEVNGMLTFGKPVTDVAKGETFWAEYHLGLTNGSNAKADNNTQKDLYGRWVMRWYGQSLGLFAFRSADQYGDNLRTTASIAGNTGACDTFTCGIMSGAQASNSAQRMGPDFTLSLLSAGIPVWLENQLMFNRESDPTGFGREFKWHGGFHQLNWQISKNTIVYSRYDWLKGDAFDDTNSTVNGVTGITRSTPKENDLIVGWQHLYDQNIKLVAEYRHHRFEDTATGGVIPTLGVATKEAHLTDNGFTLRAMFGF
jgi:hypothetical protein